MSAHSGAPHVPFDVNAVAVGRRPTAWGRLNHFVLGSVSRVKEGPGVDVRALAPVWQRELERAGLRGAALERLARVWLSSRKPPSPERVDLVRRRVQGVALSQLAREHEVAHSQVQGWLQHTGLQLLLPHLGDVASWARARTSGVTDGDVAALAGVAPELIALALDGWPEPVRTSTDQVEEAYRQWRAGAPRAQVAMALGIPRDRLLTEMRAGQVVLRPKRLWRRDLVARFGWTQANVDRYRRQELLPPPDGHASPGRARRVLVVVGGDDHHLARTNPLVVVPALPASLPRRTRIGRAPHPRTPQVGRT